jgi:hypothetical protein
LKEKVLDKMLTNLLQSLLWKKINAGLERKLLRIGLEAL